MKSILSLPLRSLAVSTLLLLTLMVKAQQSTYNVAIFLYQGVELLDFAGPTEVFASSPGFSVYTVSVDGQDILSQGLLTVKPQYGIDNAPVPDIIVFPGGNSTASSKDEKVLNWARTAVQNNNVVMSVCTGAFIQAKAGLTDRLEVTTHYGAIDGLRETLPNATVLENIRFVDNDRIISTAGVSAGIDGALHLVARIRGLETAKATARYMEYDKWNPEDGKVATINPVLKEIEKAATEKSNLKFSSKSGQSNIPFEGELTDYARELNANTNYELAAKVIEQGIKWYPNSAGLYNQLRMSYAQLLKPVPMDEPAFMALIEMGKIDEAKLQYERADAAYPGWKIFSEDGLNLKAYDYLGKGKTESAIELFLLIAKAYPDSWNAYDSLAEGYMNAGNKKEAIFNYKKSLKMNPNNINGKTMLAKLETTE